MEIKAEDISEDRVCMFGTLKEIVFFTIKAYLVRVSGLQNVENVLFLINDLNWVIIAPNQILHDVLEEIKDGN